MGLCQGLALEREEIVRENVEEFECVYIYVHIDTHQLTKSSVYMSEKKIKKLMLRKFPVICRRINKCPYGCFMNILKT